VYLVLVVTNILKFREIVTEMSESVVSTKVTKCRKSKFRHHRRDQIDRIEVWSVVDVTTRS
jgi:hypothetical protein